MRNASRRHFLTRSLAGMAAAAYLTQRDALLEADPFGWPIGCQTWPVRELIGKDFDGTLRDLYAQGFRAIEMCSPPGYRQLGFGPLVSMKASEMRERIHAAGLTCVSCHFGFAELKDHLDDRLAWAKDLGLSQMIISTFALPNTATLADWMQAADQANKIGAQVRTAGIQLGFHNHNFEFAKLDGQLIYDKLMGEFDPAVVKMQFQVAVIELGYQAVDFFEKYPGRFISMHLADWSPAEKKQVPMGQGVVDWKKLFLAARTAGVKNYFVEMDPDTMKASLPYLHSLS
jgi:sugar phosphate isomerase/epimerase